MKVKMIMIRFGKERDKEILKQLCIQSQSAKQEKFLEYYFDHNYKSANVLVSELDGKLVSQLHVNEHILSLHNKKMLVSYLSGISTHYDYRERGIMRDLLDLAIEDVSLNHLFTFVEAYHPKLFEKYGFELLNSRKRYVVYKEDLFKVNTLGVSNQFEVHELVSIYKQFSKIFDCYYERNESYYTNKIHELRYCGAQICTYHENGVSKGYCVYYEKDSEVIVSEILYLDALSLMKMLRYVVGYHSSVVVEVSENERLEKIFKQSIPRTYSHLLVRLNQPKLYSKLFNENVKNTKQFIQSLKKPILLNEKY